VHRLVGGWFGWFFPCFSWMPKLGVCRIASSILRVFQPFCNRQVVTWWIRLALVSRNLWDWGSLFCLKFPE
jgi:hypothetical protein